jgi:hypothetical protein
MEKQSSNTCGTSKLIKKLSGRRARRKLPMGKITKKSDPALS